MKPIFNFILAIVATLALLAVGAVRDGEPITFSLWSNR